MAGFFVDDEQIANLIYHLDLDNGNIMEPLLNCIEFWEELGKIMIEVLALRSKNGPFSFLLVSAQQLQIS